MKLTGKCPKCKSNDILRYKNPENVGQTGQEHARLNPNIRWGADYLTSERLICRNCGFTEVYYTNDALYKLGKRQ